MTRFKWVDPKQKFGDMEKEILSFWKEEKIFEESVKSRPAESPYRFYDGPPFITWMPHYWNLLSSICKDVVPRYRTMKWKRVERVWWWDCHGLPIEEKVQSKLWLDSNKDIEKVWVEKFIKECYNYTQETSSERERYIDHIWRWVDMENSYKTMDQDYMESVMRVFKQLRDKDLIYKWKRCSLYSWKLSTPISNFEVAMDNSYEEVQDPAITVMFPALESKGPVKEGDNILAWTTTPWTIPAHMCIGVNKDLDYSRLEHDWKFYILASSRVETVFKNKEYELISSFKWEEILWLKYEAPFSFYQWKVCEDKNFIVLDADFVTDTDGTGVAHQAPEFWDVDFQLAQKKWVHISNAVDDEWKYSSEIYDYSWMHYQEANNEITDRLRELWKLFKKESITHRVAFCPRSWTPLIYKVQDSWFINIQKIKDRLIEENENINWSPEFLKHWQFKKSIEQAPDWCISRTRYWWAPMPIWIWYNKDWKEKDIKVFASRKEIEDASWMKIKNLHKPYIDEIKWKDWDIEYRRIPEVLDVWMDSASMPYAQMHYPFENKHEMEASYPADFIVEYIWQVRAWFYVMHVIGVALFDKRSFTNVITTWIVWWNDWRKMSKSYKNYPDPKETIDNYWADSIRFYMLNSPLMHWGNMYFKEEWHEEVLKKVLLPLWNTYSFFVTYANIDNFKSNWVLDSDNKLDQWILSELNQLNIEITTAMDAYKINEATKPMLKFLDNLTNRYIRRSRKRFWRSENDADKMQAYETLYFVLTNFSQLIAPFMPFVAEHIYKNLTWERSVHLTYWPKYDKSKIDSNLNKQMQYAQTVVSLWLSRRARNKIRTRQPLRSIQVTMDLPKYYQDIIKEELNVKEVIISQELAKEIAKPDWRKLWPKFWKQVQEIIQKAKEGDFTKLDWGDISISTSNWEVTLNKDEYILEYISADDSLDLESWSGVVVSLDKNIDEELLKEWYARDLVRHIQEARKQADYNVSDRIKIHIQWDEFIADVIDMFRSYIESETLSKITDLEYTDLQEELMLWDFPIILSLKR